MNFSDLGLSAPVLDALKDVGYVDPTPIQRKAIPYVLMGRDILGCAQTGTGKTASFTLPIIDILATGRARARMARCLVLAPTRELAAQVADSFDRYGKYHELTTALVIGGSNMGDQERKLDRGVDVIIATPGRLLDLFERGKILLADVKLLVIDEADRMLDMGFIPDVERIVKMLPASRQTLFFSATMPPEVRRLADAFLTNPKEIAVDPPSTAAETVRQEILRVKTDAKGKRAALRALIDRDEIASALIFCNRKRDVDLLFKSLARHGYSAAALHGDMAQSVRTETLEGFRKGSVTFLVCSDVAARGLDLPAVSHVFNFDIPQSGDDYVHRIGRTGRAGRSGKAISIALPGDEKAVQQIRSSSSARFEEIELEGTSQAAPEAAEPAKRKTRTSSKAASTEKTAPREESTREMEKTRNSSSSAESRGKTGKRSATRRTNDPRQPRKPSSEPYNPTKSFGDHTPAFILRPAKVA